MSAVNSHPTPRSDLHQATVQAASATVTSYSQIVELVRLAIQDGDTLPNSGSPRAQCDDPNRKALIIAPIYKGDPRFRKPLESTAHDVILVYEMLITAGYDPKNIRILCDVCRGFNGRAYPTRENIIDSLEWLVHDTRPGDYRFLHFSGHGQRDPKDENDATRKEARMVPAGVDDDSYGNVQGDDYELGRLHIAQPERKTIQEVPDNIMFYKEAIMTAFDPPRDDDDPQNVSVVWDNELNEYLSKLHVESTITCIMDCCASGRILNLPDKALGAGFRGGRDPPVEQSAASPQQEPSHHIDQTNSLIADQPTSQTFNFPGSYPLSDYIVLGSNVWLEEIPDKERRLNGIKANIFHWSGCHQRQNSHDTDTSECASGALTRAFTATYKRLKSLDRPTHKELHEKVSDEVRKIIERPQFVQLWTVFKEKDKDSHDRLLNLKVVL